MLSVIEPVFTRLKPLECRVRSWLPMTKSTIHAYVTKFSMMVITPYVLNTPIQAQVSKALAVSIYVWALLWCNWNWEHAFWIRQRFIYTPDLTYVLFMRQRRGPDYHIIKVTLSTVIYFLLLNMQTNLPQCFVSFCTNLTLGDGAAIGAPLVIPYSTRGYTKQTFKAVPSPYVHYDNLLSAILRSLLLPSSPVATILFLHQLAQWLLQQANSLEVKPHN